MSVRCMRGIIGDATLFLPVLAILWRALDAA